MRFQQLCVITGALVLHMHAAVARQGGIELPPPCEDLLKPATIPYPPGGCDLPPVHPEIAVLPNDGTSWITNLWPKDRRPAVFINLFPANTTQTYGNNPRGLADWWYKTLPENPTPDDLDKYVDDHGPNPNPDAPDAQRLDLESGPNGVPDQFDALGWELRKRYRDGWRRFILQLPAGVVTRDGPANQFSANQWTGMAQWKRDWFIGGQPGNPWRDFIDSPLYAGKKIEIYVGSGVGNGICSLCTQTNTLGGALPVKQLVDLGGGNLVQRWLEPCLSRQQVIVFDPRERASMDQLYEELSPWAGVGIKRFWMDAMSSNIGTKARWGGIEMVHNPQLRAAGWEFGIESFPWQGTTNNFFDSCAATWAPWFGYMESNLMTGAYPNRAPKAILDPSMTEIMTAPSDASA